MVRRFFQPPWLRESFPLCATLLVAMALRALLATQTIVYHADEVWQYLEPAYGLITGRWIRPWDYVEGIRGWLIPMLLVPPLALGHSLMPDGQAHIYLVRLCLALASLGVPLAFYDLARPLSRRHALVAAWAGAVWPEVFYFALRSSGEGIALSLLFPAMALCARTRRAKRGGTAATLAFAAGFLLALGVVVRLQYAPAVAILAVWAIGAGRRAGATGPRALWPFSGISPFSGIWLGAGMLAAGALGALADLLAGQPPYLWMLRSILVNLEENRSAFFGTEPPWWLAQAMLADWGLACAAIVPLALLGARRMPALALVAMVVLGTHSLIPHKEFRFILLTSDTLILLAAVGSVDVLHRLARRGGWSEALEIGVGRAFWFALAVVMALAPAFKDNWGKERITYTTMVLAGQQPGLCGLATYQLPNHPALAHVFLNRPMSTLMFDGPQAAMQAAANQGAFNAVLSARADAASLPPAYHLATCYRQAGKPLAEQRLCLFVRSGGCTKAAGDFDYQSAMERRGH